MASFRCFDRLSRLVRYSLFLLLLPVSVYATDSDFDPILPAPRVDKKPPESRKFSISETYFESAGAIESIPGGVITSLAHDSSGMLWIGTQLGLVRYDGFRFRKFSSDSSDPGAISGNYVTCLWPDKDGRIWIGLANSGISVFDPQTERFTNYQHDPNDNNSLGDNSLYAIVGDKKGRLWIATNNGLDVVETQSMNFRHLRHQEATPGRLDTNRVRSLHLDHKGVLWVGSTSGLQCLNLKEEPFETVDLRPNLALESSLEIHTIFEASDGYLWLGTRGNGAIRLNPETLHSVRVNAPAEMQGMVSQSWIYSIAQPVSDEIWLGTIGKGIFVVSAKDARFLKHLKHDPTLPGNLAGDDIGALLTHRSGMLWVGTWGGGLLRYHPRNQVFQMLRHSPLRSNGLSHANVVSLLEHKDGNLLVGTAGNGIDIIDRRRGLIGGFRSQPGKAGSLADGQITALAQTQDGSIWAGTRLAGVQRLRSGSHSWQTLGLKQGLPHTQVNSLMLDRGGHLWVATNVGVVRWQEGSQRFESFKSRDDNELRIKIIAMAEDHQHRIWMASQQGLWVLEPGETQLHAIRHDPRRESSLNSGELSSVLVDKSGQVWVGSLNDLDRLVRWDGSDAEFEHIGKKLNRKEPLLCVNLLEDGWGRIWSDVFVFDPKQEKLEEFSRADGFDIDGSWRGSYGKTRDGLLLFGGPLGLAVVDPEKFQPFQYTPPLLATSLKIDGLSQPVGPMPSELVITPNQHNFSIEFSALDFSAPLQTRYAYRLVNVDRAWVETDSENRNAAYGNLWPGKYLFQVRGTNRIGEWSPHILEIPIRILPAFWQTGWFAGLLCLTLGGSFYAGHRWRTARLHARARDLQETVEARTADILNLGKIGQELTATLDLERAFEQVYSQVSARLDAHVFSIGLFCEDDGRLDFVYLIENGKRHYPEKDETAQLQEPALWCVRRNSELTVNTQKELQEVLESKLPDRGIETQVFLPLTAQMKVIGCLAVQSPHRNAYDADQLKFLRVLSSYAAIALQNANAHSELLASHKHLQESKQQLVLQEKMAGIGTLTAGIAHELNNPLNFINNLSEITHEMAQDFLQEICLQKGKVLDGVVLERFLETAGDMETNTGIILKHGHRVNQIVKAMREIVQKGGSKKGPQKFNSFVAEYVNISIKYERSKDENLIVDLQFDFDPEIQEVWLCPQDMGRVISNLIGNAAYAIQARAKAIVSRGSGEAYRGTIWVRSKKLKNKVQLEIWDNGKGIDPAHLKEVFTPFFTTKPPGQGHVGLGLSTAYDIVVKEHEGELQIESQLGSWTNVKILMPFKSSFIANFAD